MNKTIKLLLFLFLVIIKTAFAQTKPTDLTGLKLWLDASNVNNDGTTPADNDLVTVWKDRSGSGNNATVLLNKNAGAFVSNQINGKSVVRFNRISNTSGSVYQVLGLDIRAMTLPKITVFTVYKQGALSGDDQAIWGCDDGNWDRFFFSSFPTYPTTSNNGGVSQGTYATLIPNSGVVGTTQLLTAIYDSPNDQGSAIYFNGQSVANFVDKTTTGTDAQPNLRIGFDGDNNCYNGDIAEMIVYNRVLNACEIQQINHYLANKYAVPFSTVAVSISGGTSFPQGGSVTLSTSTAGTAYQWLLNGTAISGATSSSYTAKATGNYQVAVTNGCTDTSIVQTLTELPPVAPVSGGDVTVTYTGNTNNNISATGNTGTTVDWYDAATAGAKVATGVSTSTATSYTVTQKPVGTYAYYAEAREISTGNVSTTRTAVKVTINPAPITITATDVSKPYGTILSNGSSTTGFSVSGIQNSETIGSVSLAYGTGAAATASAGSYTGAITPSAATGGTFTLSNYAVTYKAGKIIVTPIAVTVTAATQSKIYGDIDPALTYNIASGALVGTDTFTGTLARAAGENTGTYAIGQGTLANGNYTITFVPANLSITPKALTISAVNQSKAYGSVNPALTLSYSGFAGTDNSTSLTTQATVQTTAVTASPVGTYPITASGAQSANYTISYTPGVLTVGPAALTITAANQSKTYGAANPALTLTYSGFVNGDTNAILTTPATISTTAVTGSPAGTYPISVSGAAAASYTITYTPGVLTVNKATLTITADNQSRTYGVANPVFTASYSGFVNGDTQASLTTLPTISSSATTNSAPGQYPITPTGAASGNYTFTYTAGTLTVTPHTNADLTNLTVSAGTLSPAFATTTFTYAVSVGYGTSTINLTPTLSDNTASVTINGAANSSGTASADIALAVGYNTITVVSTAQDGVTRKTYTVVVYRGQPQDLIVATNVLTPNGDGKNDNWVIKDIQLYPGNNVTIYDKGGRVIFTKNGYANDWNGTLNGAPLSEGTYYYIVDLGPGLRKFKGFISILRNR